MSVIRGFISSKEFYKRFSFDEKVFTIMKKFCKRGFISMKECNKIEVYFNECCNRVYFIERVFVCLFVLRLNVPVNNFSVMSGWSQRFLGLTSTVGSSCVLLMDTTRCRLWGSN